MAELPVLTTELTLQLERGVAETQPRSEDHQIAHFGRTIVHKVRGGWPPSTVFCFNQDDVGRLDEILAFFGEIEPTFLLVHAGFKQKVGEALTAAGYYMAGWSQTILYGLPATQGPTLPPGVTIEAVTAKSPDLIETAAEISAHGFGWSEPWREGAKDGVRQSVRKEHFQLFLARYESEPAGVGHLSRSRVCDTWCGLGGAAVVPRFRGKGIHTALLQHRLHTAFQLGHELVGSGANFGTTSFRNQQRVGLRLAYIEAAWKKWKPPG